MDIQKQGMEMLDQASEAAREWYERHAQIEVSDALLEDLVLIYASDVLPEEDVEAFVERMAEDEYKAAIRLDFCHCAMAVNAAMLLADEAVYRSFLGLLELGEEDQVLIKMKTFVLRKLADDAIEAAGDEAAFEARIADALKAI